jgi:hypothetical protein
MRHARTCAQSRLSGRHDLVFTVGLLLIAQNRLQFVAVNSLRRDVRLLEVSFFVAARGAVESADGRQQFQRNSRAYRDRVVELKQLVVART